MNSLIQKQVYFSNLVLSMNLNNISFPILFNFFPGTLLYFRMSHRLSHCLGLRSRVIKMKKISFVLLNKIKISQNSLIYSLPILLFYFRWKLKFMENEGMAEVVGSHLQFPWMRPTKMLFSRESHPYLSHMQMRW